MLMAKMLIIKNEAGKNSDLVFIFCSVRNFGGELVLVVAWSKPATRTYPVGNLDSNRHADD